MKILNVKQTRQLEEAAVKEGKTYLELMRNAGEGAARQLLKCGLKKDDTVSVICGHGNNGGDGFVLAAYLHELEYKVYVILADGEPKTDDASAMFERVRQKNIPILTLNDGNCLEVIKNSAWVADALYGIGFRGALDERFFPILDSIRGKVMAIDLPSGVQCDTGKVETRSFNADVTVTFSTLKLAHVLFPSAEYCGDVYVRQVGIPQEIYEQSEYIAVMTDKKMFGGIFDRKKNTHKGTYGTAVCVCGSYGMAGAGILSGSAALRSGAGLVKMCVPKEIYPITAARLTEAVFAPYSDICEAVQACKKASAVLIGCGLGAGEKTAEAIRLIAENTDCPIVIDADGINSICGHIDILRRGNIVLTPHPLEFQRISGFGKQRISSDRLGCAKEFAVRYGVCTVLKGADTVIAFPDGEVFVNPTGNAGMAKGGSGDVLSGMTVSLLAQGTDMKTAVLCAVYAHGLAGDIAAQELGMTAMLPGDMINCLGKVFKEMMR